MQGFVVLFRVEPVIIRGHDTESSGAARQDAAASSVTRWRFAHAAWRRYGAFVRDSASTAQHVTPQDNQASGLAPMT